MGTRTGRDPGPRKRDWVPDLKIGLQVLGPRKGLQDPRFQEGSQGPREQGTPQGLEVNVGKAAVSDLCAHACRPPGPHTIARVC